MSEKMDTIKLFTQESFDLLESTIEDLKEEQLDWKSCPEANTARWILTHLSEVLRVYIPQTLTGNLEYVPAGWPEDYVGNTSYSLEKILGDLKEEKKKLFKSLDETSPDSLEEEIDWFYGKKPKLQYLIAIISEILHHEGQIAAILGVEKRMKGLE